MPSQYLFRRTHCVDNRHGKSSENRRMFKCFIYNKLLQMTACPLGPACGTILQPMATVYNPVRRYAAPLPLIANYSQARSPNGILGFDLDQYRPDAPAKEQKTLPKANDQ